MVTGEHYAVCFYVKRTWIRLKAVEMGDAVFSSSFTCSLYSSSKNQPDQEQSFRFLFQMPDSIKQFVDSFFFHNSSKIQEMDSCVLRIRLHFVSFQINSCPGQDDLAIGGYDFLLQNSLAFSLFSKRRISLFGTLFDIKL